MNATATVLAFKPKRPPMRRPHVYRFDCPCVACYSRHLDEVNAWREMVRACRRNTNLQVMDDDTQTL